MACLTDTYCADWTAIKVLKKKDYNLWLDGDDCWAEKDGWDFSGYSFSSVLGLVTIHETLKPSELFEGWWKIQRGEIEGFVKLDSPKYTPIYNKSEK